MFCKTFSFGLLFCQVTKLLVYLQKNTVPDKAFVKNLNISKKNYGQNQKIDLTQTVNLYNKKKTP